MMQIKSLLSTFLACIAIFTLNGQAVDVFVNLDVNHKVGSVTTFERSKFVTMHADVLEPEWGSGWGQNFTSDVRDDFLNGYDVYLGRNTGPITGEVRQTEEDPERPGYASVSDIAARGESFKNWYGNKTSWGNYEHRNNLIVAAQLKPFWPDGTLTQTGWAFSQEDTPEKPFGTATGEYMAHFLNEYFTTDDTKGQPKPTLVEIINEPLYHIHDFNKVFRYHNTVAEEIRKINDDVLLGGYCVAFPDFEKNNFQRWEQRWKSFIDIAGENMDFWSIHLYDFPTFGGNELYRKGSNMEATFDMLEHYSLLRLGEVKGFVVSEFGASVHDYQGKWSPYRDWLLMKSTSSMMLQFMERPDLIYQTSNFLIIKATWGYDSNTGNTYPHRLMRRADEPESYSGTWVYSDIVKLYELWENVKGKRVDSWSSNPDILMDAYVEGNKAYVILNNLDFENKTIDLFRSGTSGLSTTELNVKHLYLDDANSVRDQNGAILDEVNYTEDFPSEFVIKPEATIILEYTYSSEVVVDNSSEEKKYYADKYYQPITANATNTFQINSVSKGTQGEATLRLGIGRNHGLTLSPTVLVNEVEVEVPINFRGDDQEDRASFFGVIEIDIPYNVLDTDNKIEVTFPDNGGFISSVTLMAYEFSRNLARTRADITSVEESSSQISVYPNPAQNTLHINGNQHFSEVIIHSVSGKNYYAMPVHQNEIDISQLPAGLYMLELIENNNRQLFKVIVQ